MNTKALFAEIVVDGLQPADDIPYDLLLEADPSKSRIESYLKDGICRIARIDSECVGVYVLTLDKDAGQAEIMNISVPGQYQGMGVGKCLVIDAIQTASKYEVTTLLVGTGNSSISQLAFYQKCGFRITGVDIDYFIRNYDEKIEEDGIWCRDMIRLSMNITPENF